MVNTATKFASRERSHTMVVDEGSYLLRYVSTGTPNFPPAVRVKASQKDNKQISLVPVTGGRNMQSPGDCMLVHVTQTSAIDLTVFNKPTGSLEAELRLERISGSEGVPKKTIVKAAPQSETVIDRPTEVNLDILAHVAHRGDVLHSQGEWICGPECPMQIEGIEIRWPSAPAGVGLSYEVSTSIRGREWSSEKKAGQFAGSRGKAKPLVALKLRLTGPNAHRYTLVADALFLSCQIDSRSGQEISFGGPSGREPLVGLRVSVAAQRHSSQSDEMTRKPGSKAGMLVTKQIGKVRVYRPARSSAS